MRTALFGATTWVLVLPACSSSQATAPSYPPGPYGVDQGDTIANLTLGTLDGKTFELKGVYRSASPVAVLYGTAPWCFTCKDEVAWLNAKAADPASGAEPIAIVLEDDSFGRANASTGTQFVSTYGVQFLTLIDPQGQLDAFRASSAIPVNIVVDTRTMSIALHEYGFIPADLDAAIASVLSREAGGS
jgi:hypothetical protein